MPPINPKIVKRGHEARDAAMRGVEKVYDAVSATLGPRSANVAIARPFGRPAVVHDGVTVAKEVLPLVDPFENVGAELVVEAADKTNGIGDGTTTATVLTREIATKAHTAIAAGAKPMALRQGIETATDVVAAYLDSIATPIDKVEDVKRIATVSAQNEEIGQMVADAYQELGKDGIMSVEESRTGDTYLEIKTGMEFDRGYRSPYFITDSATNEATVNNAFVLVTDYSLRAIQPYGPMLEKLVNEGVKNIVIIANDIDAEALAFTVVNHVKGNIQALAINAPSFGDKRLEILRDIAAVTGATFVSESAGMGLESVTKAYLGQATRVSSTKDSTLVVGGKGAEEDINNRAESITAQLNNPDTSEFDREKLNERMAKLRSGVAVLVVGAQSESELKERKERAIDAVSAAQAALEAGIVPGGGTALIEAATTAGEPQGDRDFVSGYNIVLEACAAPFRKLLTNAGYDPGRFIDQVGKGKGVDVMTGKLVDMTKAGIIDPVLVVKSALNNASSNAVMLATTDVIIVEQPKETN